MAAKITEETKEESTVKAPSKPAKTDAERAFERAQKKRVRNRLDLLSFLYIY